MSWEVVREVTQPCPCGKGTYKIEVLMDDWNQSDEDWTMQCPECRANYVLDTYYGTDRKGISYTDRSWIPRSVWEAREGRRQKVVTLIRATMQLLSERYGAQWSARFGGMRSKKAQWQALNDLGFMPGSLGTFYRHGAGVDHYLRSDYYFKDIPTILSYLGVQDAEIMANLEAVKELQNGGATGSSARPC